MISTTGEGSLREEGADFGSGNWDEGADVGGEVGIFENAVDFVEEDGGVLRSGNGGRTSFNLSTVESIKRLRWTTRVSYHSRQWPRARRMGSCVALPCVQRVS